MIDRFANGDTSNDVPNGAPGRSYLDLHNPRAYHGGDLRGVMDHLSYLKDLGVTAIWLTPWYDNWNGVNRCGEPWCPNTYYHGYHAIDYYSVEDHFGDLKTLRELVEKAHSLGLKVIQDQVANHSWFAASVDRGSAVAKLVPRHTDFSITAIDSETAFCFRLIPIRKT